MIKHGEAKGGRSKEYSTWSNMRNRCYRAKDKRYKDYGGRGIIVCPRWRYSLTDFILDMGRAPSQIHQIDRIDNDGPYSPENCRWATAKEQAGNRRLRFDAKLTSEKADKIRKLYTGEWGQQTKLAIQFGVSIPTVNAVLHGSRWKPHN